MRVELAPFSSLGPPLELTGACLFTRSVERHSSSTAHQVQPRDPHTLKPFVNVGVPEYRNKNGRVHQDPAESNNAPNDQERCVSLDFTR